MSPSEPSTPTPAERTLGDRALLFVASLAYLGFVPAASGTVAVAAVGVPVYLLVAVFVAPSWPVYAAGTALFTLLAVWIAGHADRVLGEKDSRRSVIDELPGFWIALVGLPVTWQIVTVAFFVERAIDIVKVWPASWVERRLPGGWSVVLDDVVAGLYTLGLLNLGVWIAPAWFGVGG